MHILHLGFEDPLMPGAGGGSVRTHEINRRMARDGHDITVLTTRYPGWAERIQDGVRYVPIGFGQGNTRFGRLMAYVVCLPFATRMRSGDADLVVEDFFAPFSSMSAPLWTKRPTIGVVQWLHAAEKSKQYRLPLHLIERAGVRQHRRMIAVSQGTADRLLGMNPGARVDVIGNGIDPRALQAPPRRGKDIVCIGRLEYVGKGIDLLLEAWGEASKHVDGQLVIAGTGPDGDQIQRVVEDSGLADRVRLIGWISGPEKYELLNSARLVVTPSRMETFGLVAVEALASGTPVIAFDIPCLREVVPAGCGWLVRPFDPAALAHEIIARYGSNRDLELAAHAGREFAATFDWDSLAAQQVDAYRAAISDAAHARRREPPEARRRPKHQSPNLG